MSQHGNSRSAWRPNDDTTPAPLPTLAFRWASDRPTALPQAHVPELPACSPGLPSRKYGSLYLLWSAVTVHHAGKDGRNFVQPDASGNVLRALEATACHQSKGCLANSRRMVKAGYERDVAIMKPVGIELYLGSFRRTAEEVDRTAPAHHLDGPLPRRCRCHSLDHNVRATALRRQRPRCGNHIVHCIYLHNAAGAEQLCRGGLALPLHHCNHLYAG